MMDFYTRDKEFSILASNFKSSHYLKDYIFRFDLRWRPIQRGLKKSYIFNPNRKFLVFQMQEIHIFKLDYTMTYFMEGALG